jgi:hypothetical protein
MMTSLAQAIHFLVTLPFPRYHCAAHHSRRFEERQGELWICCNECPRARPVNLHVSLDEIQERKVRE